MGPRRARSKSWRGILGRAGEERAASYLRAHGCRILGRRYRCAAGELDLIVEDGGILAFVEVKARSGTRYGDAGHAVAADKRATIRRVAARWLSEHGSGGRRCRFDVVIVIVGTGRARVRWLRDAF